MTPFVLLAVLLVATALFWLTRPLFRTDSAARLAPREELEGVRDRVLAQLQELEIQRSNQSMDSASADAEQGRLEFELAQILKRMESATGLEAAAGGPVRAKWAIAAALVLLLPIAATGVYWLQQGELLSMMTSINGAPGNQNSGMPPNVMEMVARLEQRLQSQPNDAQGWAMLGRSYSALNRPEDAKMAYGKAYKLAPENAEIASGYAWMLYNENPQEPTAEAVAIYGKILAREPDNLDAMWVLGLASFHQGDFRQALKNWEGLYARLPQGSPAAQGVRSAIDEARAHLSQPKK